MKRLILEQSSDEFYTSHSGLALAGACINRYSDLARNVGRVAKGSDHIAEIDILRSYLGLLCLGKSDYQAIAAMREDDYFKQALGIARMPSVERLRQRLDEAGTALVPVINRCSRTMIKRLNAPITGYKSGLVPLDVDVFPQDNSNTKKEGVGRTYKNYDGYAPNGTNCRIGVSITYRHILLVLAVHLVYFVSLDQLPSGHRGTISRIL